jgi:CheY-like chemotaxis protein/HPt (histidine-containing phosphotransfer) domain-containing protein
VLLVEDTDYNAWAAIAVLARLGLTCDRAATGAEALACFEAKRYNLILLDRNLPDVDGTEIARRLRELERGHAPALILAVTAYCTPADRALCIAAGMDAFVGKPLTPDKLRSVLAEAGRAARSAPALEIAPSGAVSAPDIALLSYLSDGSPDGLNCRIDRYLAEFLETAAELDAAAAVRDFDRSARAAHRLKGHAQMVGANVIAVLAADLETAARIADAAGIADALGRLARETPGFKAALAARRSPIRSGQTHAPAHSG